MQDFLVWLPWGKLRVVWKFLSFIFIYVLNAAPRHPVYWLLHPEWWPAGLEPELWSRRCTASVLLQDDPHLLLHLRGQTTQTKVTVENMHLLQVFPSQLYSLSLLKHSSWFTWLPASSWIFYNCKIWLSLLHICQKKLILTFINLSAAHHDLF